MSSFWGVLYLYYLPSYVSEEMLYEKNDLGSLLASGYSQSRAGILYEMRGKVVILDNVNLIPTSILRAIFAENESTSSGGGYTILAAMNAHEGSLSSALVDRFDLFVEMHSPRDKGLRMQIIEQNISPSSSDSFDAHTANLIYRAKKRVHQIAVSPQNYEQASRLCAEAYVLGHRADLSMLRAAVSHAAWMGQSKLDKSNLLAVRDFVLKHRLVNPSQELTASSNDQDPSPEQPNQPEQETDPSESNSEEKEPIDYLHTDASILEQIQQSADPSFRDEAYSREHLDELGRFSLQSDPVDDLKCGPKIKTGFGSRAKSFESGQRGRTRRSILAKGTEYELALVATIRAAAPFQRIRREQAVHYLHTKPALAIQIEPSDLHMKCKIERSGYHILFLVDTSGSMGVKQRMGRIKAMIFELLKRAYVKRDFVSLVTFRADEAQLLLPFTKSVAKAYNELQQIQTGGRTPLYLGLSKAYQLLQTEKRKNNKIAPVLIVVTDGRATSTMKGENSDQSLNQIASGLAKQVEKSIVIDTETGFVRLEKAKRLAASLEALYYTMDQLEDIEEIINK